MTIGFPKVTLAHTQPSIATTTTLVIAANEARSYLLLINNDANDVYINVGAAAVADQGIRLAANGGEFEMSAAKGNLSGAAINGISLVAASVVLVTEGT